LGVASLTFIFDHTTLL